MKDNRIDVTRVHGRTLGHVDAASLPPEVMEIVIDEMVENSRLQNNVNTISIDWPSAIRHEG